MQFRANLYREEEIKVEVEGEYQAAERGARGSLGQPEEPDWPADFQVMDVVDLATGERILISDVEEEALRKVGVEKAERGDYE